MHASAAFAILALVGSGLAAPLAANAYPAEYAPPETYSPPEYTPPEYTAPEEYKAPSSYPEGYNPDAPTYPETYNPPAYQPEHHHEQTQAANVCGQDQQASCCNSPTGEGVLAASCALSICRSSNDQYAIYQC